MKYLYFLIFFLASTAGFSQNSWVPKQGPLGGLVQDIEYYPGTSNVWALIDYRIYKSTDDGGTWSRYSSSVIDNVSIYDIEITNNTIYFLGYSELFTSADQGTSVVKISDDLFFGGRKIKRLPVSGTLVVLSSNGTPDVYYSTNNGTSWNTGYNAASVNTDFLAVNSVDQVFILVGNSLTARPYRSTDSGLTFTEQSTGIPAGAVYSISNNNAGSLVYCVYGTDLYSSTNGLSWTSIKGGNITDAAQSSTGDASFFEFTADGLGMYFIDNYNHKVFNKTVSGAASTWVLQASAFPNPATATWPTQPITATSSKNFPSATSNVVFGTTYGMLKSATGGASAAESNTGITQIDVNDLIVTQAGYLLLSASNLGMMLSTNSGDNWSRVTSLPTNISSMTNVTTGTDPTQGMTQLALSGSTLYRSATNGATWTTVTTPVSFNDVHGGDNNRAFGNNSTSVYYSKDGGTTFSATPITFAPALPAGFINDVYIPTTTGVIYIYLYNTGTSTSQYYKATLTYDVNSNITSAATALIPTATNNPTSFFGANGKLYGFNSSADNIAVYNGTSWSATRSVPNGFFTMPAIGGYMFVATSGTPGKIQISRDDGVTFSSIDLPANVNSSSVFDITVSPQGYAFLAVNEGVVHQSKKIVVLPNAPSSVAEVGKLANAAVISWIDNANNETAYRVMRSTDAVNYTVIGTVEEFDVCGATTGGKGYFTDNTVVPGTVYRYKVKAVNDAGETESGVLTLAAIPASSLTPLPDNRSWSGVNSGAGGATGFALQTPKIVGIQHLGNGRYKVSDISISTVTSNAVAQEFYVNGTGASATLVAGTATQSSSYDVKANGYGTWNGTSILQLRWIQCSNPTKFETITYTLQASDPAPTVPTLQAVIAGNTSVELSWATSLYAQTYIIERSTTSAVAGFTQLGSNVAYPATTVTDNTVTPGTTYYYRMKARNSNASPLESAYSTVVPVTFQKPNFIISATTVSSYVSATVGSYWADFDNDGADDLMTINGSLDGASLSTITIFKNLGTGNFQIKSPTIDQASYNFGSVVDMDNDGFADLGLAVSESAQVDFYKGNGDFTFTKFTPSQLGDLASVVKSERTGVTWADINNDGRLDVALTGEYNSLVDDKLIICIQNADKTFTAIDAGDLSDVADDTFAILWGDVDNDGFVDALLGDSGGLWKLFKNLKNNTFHLMTAVESGIDAPGGIAGAFGDINNDGFLDIFVGVNANNVLYINDGDGTFTKNNTTVVTEPGFVIQADFGDVNNDGLLDLIVPGYFGAISRLYINTTTGSTLSFNRIVNEKLNDINYWHIGAAMADYDKNGFLDLAMGSLKTFGSGDSDFNAGENYLFKNNNSTGNWSEVKLVGVASNKNGVGARVTVTAGGKSYTREVANPGSFVSLSSATQHFGLGAAASITNIQVKWPTNPPVIQNYPNPTINTVLTITEDLTGPTVTTQLPAPGAIDVNAGTTIEITLNEASTAVAAKVLTITATGDASPTLTINVTSGTVVGNKFTYTLPSKLLANKHYDLAIDAGAFIDIYGNNSLAISGWAFTTAAGPQFTTISPAANATGVALNAAIVLTANTNITAVAGKKIKVMNGTSAVLDADVSTTGTLANNQYTIAAPSAGWPSLATLAVLLDAGAFVDASLNENQAIAGTTWTFTTVDAADVTAPVFGNLSGLPVSVDKASLAQSFSIPITDNKGVTAASMFVKSASGAAFTEVTGAASTGNAWQFQLTAGVFDATGVQYYFTARDAAANQSRSPLTGTYKTLVKYGGTTAQVPAGLVGTGGTEAGWKVIAVPFDLGANNGVQSVFDELTGTIKKDYRILRYTETPTPGWIDYPDFSTIDRGVGYFINIKTPVNLIVGTDLVAPNNSRENLYQLALKKGWNMIGNPYLEPIDWANVTALNGLTGTAAVFKKFAGGNYSNNSTLGAYEGGFVQLDADKTVSIPFQGQTVAFTRVGAVEFGPNEWLVPIVVQQGAVSNTFGGVGMHSLATKSYDSFDDTNGPRWFTFAELNFKHPEHFAQNFARDVVPVADEYTWEFTIESNVSENGLLRWDNEQHPVDKDLYLYDSETQTPVNMRENNSYSFDPKISRSFKIYYGDNALLRIKPARVLLGAAYPNPTSKGSTIPFSIPEHQGGMRVRLEMFDMTGRNVGTLANGEFAPGFYHGEWQPQEGLSNGIYVYRLLAGDEVLTGKVVLKK